MTDMEVGLFQMLWQTAGSGPSILLAFSIIGAMMIAATFISKLGDKILPKPKETRVADFLPFSRLDEDGATIHLRNDSMCRVLEVSGADTTLIMPEERQAFASARKQWIDSMAELQIVTRVITIRERVPLSEKEAFLHEPLLKTISTRWLDSLHRIFRNRHYIILSVNDRKNALKDLDQATNATLTILDMYKPVLVSEKTPERSADKSPFWLFARLMSPLTRPKPIIHGENGQTLNDLLTADYIHFTKDEGIIRFFSGDKEKMGIVIGIRKPGDFMDEQMIADIMSIDCEVTILHNIKPIPTVAANAKLIQQRRMAYITSFSMNVYNQYTTALEWMDQSDADGQSLNEYAMSVFVFGDSKEELKFGQEEVEKICRLHNVTPVRDGWAAQAVFFSQLPTYDVYPRTFMYLSRVVACAINIDKTDEGQQKSDWGPVPLSYFRTVTGTPYAFQFHVSPDAYALGHTVLIGPSGQGKTTFFSFMAGQAQRIPDLNVYFFDRNNGAKIFAMMQGAPYVKFDGGADSVSLNPFAIPDTPDNRSFLRTWLRDITGGTDAVSEQEIARAVTTSFDYLRPQERLLKNLYKSCFSNGGFMRRELLRWIDDEQYGRVFNSTEDNLDLESRYMGFDFTRIFDDPVLSPAVISYVMHRIHTLAASKGTPTMIMIDETAPMLEHEMFRKSFEVGLREGRKKRQVFLCAFQQPEFLETHQLGEIIRSNCPTWLFFRNPNAQPADYESWGLTPRELNFVMNKEFIDHKYAVLVKRPTGSVILDLDLSGLGPYLKVYSSGNKNVMLAEQLAAQLNDTDALVQAYLQRAP